MKRSINSLVEAEQALREYVPSVSKYFGDGLSLDRMWPLLELCDNPHEKLKVIHIAGTSGKTSTAYYSSAYLQSSGKKVGLTVSPYVYSLNERVQIDTQPLHEKEFVALLSEFLSFVDELSDKPSYFELLVVFALWVFVRKKVDYAVIETGVGGLLDGSNVITRQDKVCVITDIGYDHQNLLGNTLSEIATQKAGIIHQDNVAITHVQNEEIMQPILDRVAECGAELIEIETIEGANLPDFQKRNWTLAKYTCEFIAERDSFSLSEFDPNSVLIPGRVQVIEHKSSKIILDGAHNPQKMSAFVASFIKKHPGQKVTTLLALKEGKDVAETLAELQPIVSSAIVTSFKTTQDLPVHSEPIENISEELDRLNVEHVTEPKLEEAVKEFLESSSEIKLIIGSFYFLGQVRPLIPTE